MNEPPDPPRPSGVTYSRRVREMLRAHVLRAMGTALEAPLRDAILGVDRRLRMYPQFGDPLCDLSPGNAQLWIGTVPPLVLHYIIDEERRQVIVVRPMKLLPKSGL